MCHWAFKAKSAGRALLGAGGDQEEFVGSGPQSSNKSATRAPVPPAHNNMVLRRQNPSLVASCLQERYTVRQFAPALAWMQEASRRRISRFGYRVGTPVVHNV